MNDAETKLPRIGVLLSGGGRTLANLGQSVRAGYLEAQIGLVVASKVCGGCDRARDLGIEPVVMNGVMRLREFEDLLARHRIDLVVLAGYVKKLPIPPAYRGKIVNIHPALLPSFGGAGMYGMRVHEAVIAHGCKVSGCTVHLVDEEYDRGPILAQTAVPVMETDTPESLAARVFQAECATYPMAISKLLQGRVRFEGRRALVS